MFRNNILLVSGCLICVAARAALSAGDREKMDCVFAATNTPRQVEVAAYEMLSNCWFSNSNADPAYFREVQYNILTNACRFKSRDIQFWTEYGMSYRYDLFKLLCSFDCGTNGVTYVERYADFLGEEMSPSSRDDILPRVVFNFNCEVAKTRQMILKRFSKLVARCENSLEGESREHFRSNIIERARLTEDERRIVWPEE